VKTLTCTVTTMKSTSQWVSASRGTLPAPTTRSATVQVVKGVTSPRSNLAHAELVPTEEACTLLVARAARVVGRSGCAEDCFVAGAFGWGLLAASSLVLGAALALRFSIGLRTIGLVMGFGAGVLLSAVSFDLIEEAVGKASGHGATLFGIFAGCGVFFGGDLLIDRAGGAHRKSAHGRQADESALAIVLGTVLDGIPESIVIGLTIYESGAVGAAYLAAVFISNVPEAISSTAGLASSGWRPRRILGMWTLIALVSGLASLVGYVAFRHASPDAVAFMLAFAAGAILTMLADTMMPEAYKHGGKLVGVVTTVGFALAFLIEQLD
jgi:zinc transporter, ZIP family